MASDEQDSDYEQFCPKLLITHVRLQTHFHVDTHAHPSLPTNATYPATSQINVLQSETLVGLCSEQHLLENVNVESSA